MAGLLRRFALACVGLACAARGRSLIKGISYGPAPIKTPVEAARLPQDDWFCDAASPMWSSSGRGDLRIMRSLGANLVRLYGNNPENRHGAFLDEAQALGLKVAPGMSDWPYYQKFPGNCKSYTDFNCFGQLKELYLSNLRNGFLTASGAYHPALRVMNIVNEPDLKLPPTTNLGGPEGPVQMGRAIISAFDAMLEAEKEANVTGPLINFTATFSYGICMSCRWFSDRPALGQMAQLADAMRHPERYGYTPRNDLAEAYRTRWMNSFNTQNPATDMEWQFLNAYAEWFPATPVYIGEYHRVGANQTEDVGRILQIAERHPLFFGISFFEYTVSYYKTGTEMDFGMFGFAEQELPPMSYFAQEYPVYCLTAEPDRAAGTSMPEAIARVYGGKFDKAVLCGRLPKLPETTTATATTTTERAAATTAMVGTTTLEARATETTTATTTTATATEAAVTSTASARPSEGSPTATATTTTTMAESAGAATSTATAAGGPRGTATATSTTAGAGGTSAAPGSSTRAADRPPAGQGSTSVPAGGTSFLASTTAAAEEAGGSTTEQSSAGRTALAAWLLLGLTAAQAVLGA